ncbi:MAG: hypothetical protein EPO35_02910 [Acidobacteria bacterium]|nr:MAG: hypothetical protein EPO35_02910 [Acidobacteriota bacterium]
MSPETPETVAPTAAETSAGKPTPRRGGFRRWGLRVLALILAVVSGLIVTFFSIDLGPRVKGLAEREASKFMERPMHIGSIRALVGRGEFEFTDVRIEGLTPDAAPFLVAKRIRVSLPWWTAASRKLVIDRIHMSGWRATVETWPGDKHNIPKFTPKTRRSGGWIQTTTTREIVTDDGEFVYDDHGSPWSVVCRNMSVVVVRALGSYYGRMGFKDGTVKVQSYLPMTAAMQAGFKFEQGHMLLNRIHLDTDGASTEMTGDVDFGRWPEQIYKIKSNIQWPEMRRVFFDGSHFELDGHGTFDGTFHKYRGGYEVNGRFASPQLGVLTSFGHYLFPKIDGDVKWTPTRLDVTRIDSEFFGGRAQQVYTLAPLGAPTPPTATWDVKYQNVDATALGAGLEWPVLRLAGRLTGRNFMTWTNGHFGDTKVGDGEMSSVSDAALKGPEIPEGLQPVDPEKPFDAKRRISPFEVAGNIKYTWAPSSMEVAEGSWASTPHTYLRFHGRTEYGDNSRMPFRLTSTDWLESDRLLSELMAAFNSTSTPIDVGGFGTFDGVMTKAFWNPHIEGTFAGEHMRAWDVDWGRGTGKAVIENNYADITDGVFYGRYPGSRIDTAGRFSLGYPRKDRGREIDARINVVRWPLVELRHAFLMDLWPVDGLGSAELHLYGEYERPDGFGNLRIDNGSAWEESFDYATADLRFEYAGVRVDGIELHKSTGIVRGAAFADWHSETYSFNADGQKIPVESVDNWRYETTPFYGQLQFTANGTGSFLDPTYEARGSIADLYAGDEGVGQVTARLRYVKETIVIEQLEAASPRLSISGTGRVAMNDEMDSDLTLRATNTRIDPYLRLINPATQISPYATASLTGAVRISGELADIRYLSVDATVEKAELSLFDYPLHNDGPIHITFGENAAHVGRLRLVGEDTQLDLSGDVSLTDEQVNIKARGSANIAVLQAFFPDLRSSGSAEVTADVTGDMRSPQFSGSAAISQGRIRHFALPHSFEDLNGTVRFDTDGLRVDGLKGKLGGGEVTFGGTIGLKGYVPDELNLSAIGRNMTLRYPEGFQSRVNTDLFLRGTMSAAELSGTVNVLHATMTRELDSEVGLLGFTAAEAIAAGGGVSGTVVETGIPLTYEIQILAPQTLRIDSSLAHVIASGDLTVRGTYDHPTMTGRVDINRAEAIIQGNRYVLTRGAVEFTNPVTMQPVFDIEAETRIRVPGQGGAQTDYGQNYRISVTITGTTDRLTPTLTSDPQLPQIDIVSLLFGETDPKNLREAELRTLDSGQRANLNLLQASAARLLTSPLSTSVGRVMERTLGVDTVQITPLLGFSDTAQLSPTARVTLGKRVSDRVFVTYSRAINTGRAEVILLEYDQNDRMSWVLSKNEDQSFALDFRVRYRF